MSAEIPQQLVTNTETKVVLLTPELEAALPGIEAASQAVDDRFTEHSYRYLVELEQSQFTVKTKQGAEVACSLLMNDGKQADEIMVVFAPFADRNPKTSADVMWDYIQKDPTVGKIKAKPNSWNQTTKSAIDRDLLEKLGYGMPVLTIYAPVPLGAHSAADLEKFNNGDFSPSGRLTMEAMHEAIKQAKLITHGSESPQDFHKLHVTGASLGANNAIGASAMLLDRGFNVQSVSGQELVMGPTSGWDLVKRFTIAGTIGEESTTPFPKDAKAIGEAALRIAIDGRGSEIIGMYVRMAQGASKLSYMRGMTKPQPTIDAVEKLLDNNVSVLVATADNSAMSEKARTLLPDEVTQVRLTAQEGKKLAHIVDEYARLSSFVVALGVAQANK